MIGMSYGQTPFGLAKNTGLPLVTAEAVHKDLRRIYARYWRWIETEVMRAEIAGSISTPLGWLMPVTKDTPHTRLLNFPMQAACSDIMRLATTFMLEEGLAICCTVHDAVLIEAPIDRIEADAEVAKECWRHASEIVLDGFKLGADCKIFRYPECYHDDDGSTMWNRILNTLTEVEGSTGELHGDSRNQDPILVCNCGQV